MSQVIGAGGECFGGEGKQGGGGGLMVDVGSMGDGSEKLRVDVKGPACM